MATTPTTSATPATSSTASIVKTLGTGSGLDIGALVNTLVEAQFAAKTQALTKRQETLTAQISGISTLRSGITGFDTALTSLVTGGTLKSKLTSSNEAAVTATPAAGATVSSISASVGVVQLASAQVSTANTAVARASAWQTGTLTLRMGRDVVNTSGQVTGFTPSGGSIAITIGSADATLDGIAAKINATAGVAAAGVVASVIDDGAGARLVLRGTSGGDKAFEVAVSGASGGGNALANLAVSRTSATTTSATRARDAIVQVDGVRYTRATNTIEGVVPNVTLNLLATTTTDARLSMTRPTAALSTAVNDFVSAYNEMLAQVRELTDPFTGTLRSDPTVSAMARSLGALTTTNLVAAGAAGAPQTLASLGVATARDGTLSVNAAQLATAVANYPDQVEAMFAQGAGLPAALSAIARSATDRSAGLDAATTRYTREAERVTDQQGELTERSEASRTRLTRQFASMDSRVAAYKSTQSFLEQQIDSWNKSS